MVTMRKLAPKTAAYTIMKQMKVRDKFRMKAPKKQRMKPNRISKTAAN